MNISFCKKFLLTQPNASAVRYSIEMKDIFRIMSEILQIDPMIVSLLTLIAKKENVTVSYLRTNLEYTVQISNVIDIVNSLDFIQTTSKQFVNRAPTINNINCISTVLILWVQLQILSPEDIKLGINSFVLTAREYKLKNLPFEFEIIQKALRLLGRVISPEILKVWFQQVEPLLHCRQKNVLFIEDYVADYEQARNLSSLATKRARDKREAWIAPHEFLLLMTNAEDKIQAIVTNHVINKTTKTLVLKQAEQPQFSGISIHLLHDKAFQNRAPQRLVEEQLKKDAERILEHFDVGQDKRQGKDLVQIMEHLLIRRDPCDKQIKEFCRQRSIGHLQSQSMQIEREKESVQVKYSTLELMNALGKIDFSLARDYNPEIVRHNLDHSHMERTQKVQFQSKLSQTFSPDKNFLSLNKEYRRIHPLNRLKVSQQVQHHKTPQTVKTHRRRGYFILVDSQQIS